MEEPSPEKFKTSSQVTHMFFNAEDIIHTLKTALNQANQDAMVRILIALRNQLSLSSSSLATKPSIAPNDTRLLLAQSYLTASPGAQELFKLWDSVYPSPTSFAHPQNHPRILSPLVSLFAVLLTLLSSHYTFHGHGQAIVKTLLQSVYVKRLSTYLATAQTGGIKGTGSKGSFTGTNELVLVTMKLWLAMSEFAGGKERRKVIENFGWETKLISKLLTLRRRSRASSDQLPSCLIKPDIRTLTLAFLLMPLSSSSLHSSLKHMYMMTPPYPECLGLIWKGLDTDDPEVVRYVLEHIWVDIWCDKTIPRKEKVAIFGEPVFAHLVKLYARDTPTSEEPNTVADLVHHFLLAICTRPDTGVCFRDRGWYPRDFQESVEEEERIVEGSDNKEQRGTTRSNGHEPSGNTGDGVIGRGKIYNKILANVLKMLKVNEDARQQELALRILTSCPELVSGYWSSSGLTLEPRLSSKWITNVAFVGSVISLPIPESSFLLRSAIDAGSAEDIGVSHNADQYCPSPPPLSNILENIIPSPLSPKVHLSKALSASATAKPLVQHCAALALIKCLAKLERVMNVLDRIESVLSDNMAIEEDLSDMLLYGRKKAGLWGRRRIEVVKEVRKRIPDFQVVLAFAQVHSSPAKEPIANTEVTGVLSTNSLGRALLAEVAQRLVWMYQRCLLEAVAETKFDVGKVLSNLEVNDVEDDPSNERTAESKLEIMKQLHVLRLLKDSDQLVLSAKSAPSSHTNLYILLRAYTTTTVSSIRIAVQSLLTHLLSHEIIFQASAETESDSSEPSIWLRCLPAIRRISGNQAADGTILKDERESLISFLDDCFWRCMKRVYTYIEDMHRLVENSKDEDLYAGNDVYPSPFIMTVLEQFRVKVEHKLLDPSDILGILTFVRKLVFRLMSKLQHPVFLSAFVARVGTLVSELEGFEGQFRESESLRFAVKREIDMMTGYLKHSTLGTYTDRPLATSKTVDGFLKQIASLPTPSTKASCMIAAYELVDWVRLVNQPLCVSDISRVAAIIQRHYPPAVQELVEHLALIPDLLWDGLDVISAYDQLRQYLCFEWLFIHSDDARLLNEKCRRVLIDSLSTQFHSLTDTKSAIRLILHRLMSCREREAVTCGLLSFVASIVNQVSKYLTAPEYTTLKEFLFARCQAIREVSTSSNLTDLVRDGLSQVVGCLQPGNSKDRAMVVDLTSYWLETLKSESSPSVSQVTAASIWMPLVNSNELLSLLDNYGDTINDHPTPGIIEALKMTLRATRESVDRDSSLDGTLYPRLDLLLSFRPLLEGFSVLEDLLAIAVQEPLPIGHDGHDARRFTESKAQIASLIGRSVVRWSNRTASPPLQLDLHSFLFQRSWSSSTAKIICGILYRSSFSRDVILRWLQSENCVHQSIHDVATILHAFFDTSLCRGHAIPDLVDDAWLSHFPRLLNAVTDMRRPQEMRRRCAWCVSQILMAVNSRRDQFVKILMDHIQPVPSSGLSPELINIALHVKGRLHSDLKQFGTALVSAALEQTIECFSRNFDLEDENDFVVNLTLLLECKLGIRPQFVEPVLSVAIQNQFRSVPAIKLASSILTSTSLKPLVVNRYLQSTLQHSDFFRLCTGSSPLRDAIIDFLYISFNLHPVNTCQPSHVEPVVRIYGGSLALSDRKLLSIFPLFEAQRKTSVSSLLCSWSASGNASTSPLEALQSLDPALVLRTCLNFPRWRHLDEQLKETMSLHENGLYDPVFLILLFSQVIVRSPPASGIAWVEVFRTNIVCLLIRTLAVKDDRLRELAVCQITAIWKLLKDADMREKEHVLYVLDLLKDALPAPSQGPVKRIPSYTTLILLHAIRSIFYPSNFIYPLTARFLLQRPMLDTRDVPMLYGMLYSTSDDWKKERGWIIRFLSDGLISSDDWRVFKRRHTWDLLASLFQGSEKDRTLRHGILDVLANLTCNREAATFLLLKSALLSWIEMQIQSSIEHEHIAWVRILENILITVDTEKMETKTNGEWRAVICRCLSKLLSDTKPASATAILPAIAPVVLRLSSVSQCPVHQLPRLLVQAVEHLKSIEQTIELAPPSTRLKFSRQELPRPPYTSPLSRVTTEPTEMLQLWGRTVECLWRTSMALERKVSAWDELSNRLLIWRSLVGEENCSVGEWARKEVVRNLHE